MKRSYFLFVSILIILSILVTGCTTDKNDEKISKLEADIKEKDDKISKLEDRIKKLEGAGQISNKGKVFTRGLDTILFIKNKDMESMSSIVHPNKGLRFIPYDYIDIEKDRVFTVQYEHISSLLLYLLVKFLITPSENKPLSISLSLFHIFHPNSDKSSLSVTAKYNISQTCF